MISSIRRAAIAALALTLACAGNPVPNPGSLAPAWARITDQVINRDLATIDSAHARLAALDQQGKVSSYERSAIGGLLGFARLQYVAGDGSGVVDRALAAAELRLDGLASGAPVTPGLAIEIPGNPPSTELEDVVGRSLKDSTIVLGESGEVLAQLEIELLRLRTAARFCPPESLGRARNLAAALATPVPLPPLPVQAEAEAVPEQVVVAAPIPPAPLDTVVLPSGVNCGEHVTALDDTTKRTLDRLAQSLGRSPTLRLAFAGSEGSNLAQLDSAYLVGLGADPRQFSQERKAASPSPDSSCVTITYIVPGDLPLRIIRRTGPQYIVPTRVTFATSTTALDTAARARMLRLAQFLVDFPAVQSELLGFADPRGGARANKKLSDNRAAASKAVLLAAGVEARRIGTVGRGAVILPRSGATDAEYRAERRVEFHLRIPATYRLRITPSGNEVILEQD